MAKVWSIVKNLHSLCYVTLHHSCFIILPLCCFTDHAFSTTCRRMIIKLILFTRKTQSQPEILGFTITLPYIVSHVHFNLLTTNVLICSGNQLNGFYMMGTFVVKRLIDVEKTKFYKIQVCLGFTWFWSFARWSRWCQGNVSILDPRAFFKTVDL